MSDLNAFILSEKQMPAQSESKKDGALSGLSFAVTDNFSTRDIETTCSSQILKGYIPPFDGFAVEKMKEAGAKLVGKLNMAEFGVLGTPSIAGAVKNPHDSSKKGGPCGAAAAVVSGAADVALASDAGGLSRVAASYSGAFSFKPSYGAISRFGLIYTAGSMDQIAVTATTVFNIVKVLDVISGNDSRDTTSLPQKLNYAGQIKSTDKPLLGVRIGIPQEYLQDVDAGVEKAFKDAVLTLEKLGAVIESCSLPSTKYVLAAHDIIFAGESSAMLAKYDGTRFGPRAAAGNWHEMVAKTRALFGPAIQRRIMLGIYLLSAAQYKDYYVKALQTRTLIVNEMETIFKNYDLLISPTTQRIAPALGTPCRGGCDGEFSSFSAAIGAVDLAGLPAASVPCGFVDKMPVGLQIVGGYLNDAAVISAMAAFESTEKDAGKKSQEAV
jgi:aspartyl-tRNA(Asn)/glutamyl-tRNA(Gln) amidotransferase subunit A